MPQVKKLSTKTVFGAIKPEHYMMNGPDGKPVPADKPYRIARFGGVCVGSKMVPVPQFPERPATAFLGDFVGVNADTGEVQKASTLYLPDICATWLSVQLARPEVKGVEFLFDVFVIATENTRPGALPYMYVFEHVMPAQDTDPISRLLAAGQTHSPIAKLALPAPPAPPAPAPAPEPAPAPILERVGEAIRTGKKGK